MLLEIWIRVCLVIVRARGRGVRVMQLSLVTAIFKICLWGGGGICIQ